MLEINNDKIEQFCKKHPFFSVESILLFIIDEFAKCTDATDKSIMESMFERLHSRMDQSEKNIRTSIVSQVNEDMLNEMFGNLYSKLKETEQILNTSIDTSVKSSITELTLSVLKEMKEGNASLVNLIKISAEMNDGKLEEKLRRLSTVELKSEIEKLTLQMQMNGVTIENTVQKVSTENLGTILESMRSAVDPVILMRLDDIQAKNNFSADALGGMKTDINRISRLEDIMKDLSSNFNKYFDRMKNPSSRGHETETQLKIMLELAFPRHEVKTVASSQQKGRMDLNLVMEGKPTILIDSKDYKGTVPKTEVEKFERDIMISNNHGILFAPYGGIYNKDNFQICKYQNRLGVYVCNTGLSVTDIKNAVQVIYDLHDSMIAQSPDNSTILSSEDVDKLNTVIGENIEKLKTVKNHLQLAIHQCDMVMFDRIKQIVGIQGKDNEKITNCSICFKEFPNAKSLGSHKRHCKKQNSFTESESNDSISSNINVE